MVTAEGKQTLVTCIIVTVVASIVVALRLYSRLVLVGGVGWDDVIISSSSILNIVLAVVASQEVRHGLGNHVWENPPSETAKVFQYVFASILIYLVSLCLTKLSILLQYLRIFGTQQAMRIACYATITFVVTYTFVAGFMNIFNCKPIHYFWSRALDPTSGSCLDFEAVWFTHAGINIFSDFLVIVLPMPVLKSLKIHKRQKIALMAIFAFGSFGGVTAILRLKSLAKVSKSNDVTYDNTGALLWSTVECNVAIMCASLPSLKVLISRYFPHLLSTIGSGSRSNPNSGRYHSRSWRSRGEVGELYGLKPLDSNNKSHDRRKSAVQTRIAKARSQDDASESSDEGIKVTTVMSQQQERNASSYFSAQASDAASVSESERRFFQRVP
ncbi:uncharacterized protein J3D65DRAFT_321019 [Phyllosticta citribraziliensis]|uniref:Rhodopsin domain-containing protein n=1 Tax=Phyllosticta citribraziliensis TaxID=989973 RepID=A0ABR1LSQ7_9PEZI